MRSLYYEFHFMRQIPDSNRKSSNARARELHLRLYAESESDFLKMGISYF